MTKSEQKWCDSVRQLGCIVCRNEGRGYVPCSVHHILSGGRRIGHHHVIGLCPTHHQSGLNNDQFVSRHPFRRAFEKRYGTEDELLAQTRELVNNKIKVAA